MHIQITLFIIWIRILHSTKQKKIFFQSETVYLLLKFIPQFSLTQYIPACFYTLIFPAAGLCAALISQSLLPAGFLCGVVTSVLSFLLTDAFHCIVLWAGGKAAWAAGAQVFLREVCVSILLVVPVVLLFSAVFRRTHLDD